MATLNLRHRTSLFPTRSVQFAVLAVAICVGTTAGAGRHVPDPPGGAYAATSQRAERGYFSQFPFERLDLVNGTLTLTFSDLVLPGNAGMDLRITRTYCDSCETPHWSFWFSRVPMAVDMPAAPNAPRLFNPDGTFQNLHDGVMSSYWVSSDFARFDASSKKLYLPNGWVATYEDSSFSSTFKRLHDVQDAYGNAMTPGWDPTAFMRLQSVTQTVADAGSSTRSRTVSFGYNNTSQPSSMSYGGYSWSYTYESGPEYRLTAATPSIGSGWSYAYDTNTMTVTTPNGGTVTYTFGTAGGRRVVSEVETGGRGITSGTWSVDYGSGDTPIATVSTPGGRDLAYQHQYSEGPDGKQWVLTDQWIRDGSTTVSHLERTYHDTTFTSGHPLKALASQTITQDGVTYTTTSHYSGSNFDDFMQPDTITESGSPANRVTSRTFHTFSSGYLAPRVSEETLTVGSESFTRSVEYDANGFVTSQTGLGVTTTFSPDSFGNLATVTDSHNHVTTTSYEWGVPASVQTPEYTISRSINADGSVASETRNGHATTFTYDDLGRPTEVAPPTGNATTTSYASDGSSVTVTRGSTWATTTVDGFGRATATSTVAGVSITATYDAEGRRIFASAPFSGSSGTGNSFDFDALGRTIAVTHADDSTVTYSYANGDVAITDENGHTTTQHWAAFGRPGAGRLASVTDAKSNTWTYTYNALGSLTRVQAPTGPDRTWSYHSTTNRLLSETQPESGTTTYTYEDAGLVASKTDALNRTTAYQYDGNHRLTGIIAPVSADSVTFEYDDADNRTVMATGGAASTFTFDAANRLRTRVDDLNGHTFTTTYDVDDNDNLTKITYPSGRIIQYAYDTANRVSRVYDAATTYADDLAYHPSGVLASMTYGNQATETLTLDNRFRPAHLQDGPLDLTYGYDRVGNVLSIDDGRSTYQTFSYDELDRLTSVNGEGATTFTYDALGNRWTKGSGATGVEYTYSSTTNRLSLATSSVSSETGTFTYFDVGTLESDGTTAFAYTSHDMMRTATRSGATTSYSYDAAGLRVMKASANGVRYYVHGPGGLLLAEYDATTGTPVLAREYVYLGSRLLASFAASVPAPTVTATLTAPLSGTVTPSHVAMALTADAAITGGGSIASVAFYANGQLLATDTSSPYAATWTPTVAGTYALTARAVGSTGKVGHSTPVTVTVAAIGRVLGVAVSPTGPSQGETATVTVSGNQYACGAVQLNFGDGTVTTYAHDGSLQSAPLQVTHAWSTTGAKTVTATGQGDCFGTASTTVTIAGNTGPTVSLTAPTAGTYTTGATITLTASASDAQGVARVEFYDGTTLVETDTATPWTYNWTTAAEGTHTLKARAVDSLGAWTDSATVTITVQDVASVSVSANPVTGQAATVTVSGSATGCGAVTVNYGDGDVVTYAIDGLPISNYHTWTTGGTKTVTATGQGNCTGSAQTSVTVNAAPSVSLTAPAANDTFYTPATITLTASASDSDGSIASVAFYAGSTLLGTDTTAPYSYSWSGMGTGTYSLTAVATDNQSATTTSSAVSITVADPSASTVTGVSVSPASAAVNASVTVTVTGGNPCGAVQINFGDGQAPYLPISGLPYQITHSWSQAGTYTITASGQGNCAGQASTSITIGAPIADEALTQTPQTPQAGWGPRVLFVHAAMLEQDETAPDREVVPLVPINASTTVTMIVDLAPGASGTVTSVPSGFNCTGQDTSCTAAFDASATVTLTATPDTGHVFLGWGGACAGTNTTCVVTAADALLVTAAFGGGASPTLTYYHVDALGSVRATTDANKTTLLRHDYGAFGESISDLTGDPRRYIGGELDPETAFEYLGARYYRNLWGRFTRVDPIISSGAMTNPQLWNRYAYGLNNPLHWVDPAGLEPQKTDTPTDGQYTITLPGAPTECLWGCGVDPVAFALEGLLAFWQGPRRAPGQQLDPLRLVKLVPSADLIFTTDRVGEPVQMFFLPDVANRLVLAIREMNALGIFPQFNSAFRTPEYQRLLNPGTELSWHMGASAVDINGPGTSQFSTIVSIMESHNFRWGHAFINTRTGKPDDVHFDGEPFLGTKEQAIIVAQALYGLGLYVTRSR